MMYEWERLFVVDASKFQGAFGPSEPRALPGRGRDGGLVPAARRAEPSLSWMAGAQMPMTLKALPQLERAFYTQLTEGVRIRSSCPFPCLACPGRIRTCACARLPLAVLDEAGCRLEKGSQPSFCP